MRNNQDRFSPFQQAQQNFVSPIAQANQPVFNFVTPVELVDLPSGGKYYPQNHPLCGKSVVEIKHMTAREEDILSNKSYIEKGIVLDKLLESIMMDKNIDPQSILIIDKNAILLKARITGYGEHYPSSVFCPTCASVVKVDFNLNDLAPIQQAQPPQGAVVLENGFVAAPLPISKWKVVLKPLSGYDQELVSKAVEMRKKHNLEENILLETLKSFIYSVNDITDSLSIQTAIENMPARDSKYIRTIFPRCFPSITTSVKTKCENCKTETDSEVPFNSNFFWPE